LHHWLTRVPFAHRGLHDGAAGIIENSLSAFRAAIANGVGIELDVQATADGRAAVFHDATLDRLTQRAGRVADCPLGDLEAIPLNGSTDCIAGLARVLDLIDGAVPLLIEIKGGGDNDRIICEAVARALDRYNGDVAVMSFQPGIVGWFRDNRAATERGLVASTRYRRELGWRLSHPAMHRRIARELEPDFIAYDIRNLPNSFTTGWRSSGRPLLTWTVRTADHHHRARRFADNIIFEKP